MRVWLITIRFVLNLIGDPNIHTPHYRGLLNYRALEVRCAAKHGQNKEGCYDGIQ